MAGGFWCQKCAFCYFWKKKKPNWPNCEPIKVCKHTVKTCSDKHSCQVLEPGLLLDVLLPTGPQEGTLPLPSPRVLGEKVAAPSPRILPAEPSPGASHSPEPLAGCSGLGTSHWHWGGSGPWCKGCAGAAWCPPTDPSITWDHPHSESEPVFTHTCTRPPDLSAALQL